MLEWQLAAASEVGVDEVVVVGGHRADALRGYDVRLVVNERYEHTNMVTSLFAAEAFFGEDFIMSYGDIAYRPSVLKELARSASPVAVVVDEDWLGYWGQRFDDPLDDAESLRIGAGGTISSIGQPVADVSEVQAQYVGLVRFQGDGVLQLRAALEGARVDEARGVAPLGSPRDVSGMYMTDLLQGLADRGVRLQPVRIHGGWVEIDSLRDVEVAHALVSHSRLEDPA